MNQGIYGVGEEVILETQGLSRKFGGVIAINNLDISVNRGELRCIIGPNGAGKSTLFNLITGVFKPTSGRIIFKDHDIVGISPDKLSRMGIGRKFQVPNIFLTLTVKDNLLLALHGTHKLGNMFVTNKQADEELIVDVLKNIRLEDKAELLAAFLSHGEKQWLEIGMVLISSPTMMLLDEPTAGMSPEETAETAELIKMLANKITIVVIEHDINFIRQVGGTVTVLHRGSKLAEGLLEDIEQNEVVMDVYFGRHRDLVC